MGHIATALRTLLAPGQVCEVRALGCTCRARRSLHTRSGYFDYDHIDDAVAAAKLLTGRGSEMKSAGVYITLNPVLPDLLARRSNRVDIADKDYKSTNGTDIVARRWLLIDCDPIRPPGISSTDSEFHAARLMARRVSLHLTELGWPDPVVASSGNGYHLLYRIDLPAQDGGLVARCLKGLAAQFDSAEVTIDTKVHDANRICKLYGTVARKGDHTEQRPHRLSSITINPQPLLVVPVSLLEILASHAPAETVRPGHRRPTRVLANSVTERARKYLLHLPESIDGQSGHDKAYRAACELLRGFSLSIEHAWPLLCEFNERCQPPWSERELQHKLEQAEQHAEGEPGYLLLADKLFGDKLPSVAGSTPEFAPAALAATPPLTAALPALPDLSQPIGEPLATVPAAALPPASLPAASPLTGLLGQASAEATGLNETDDDPFRLARVFLRRFEHADGIGLHYWRESFWVWPGHSWRPMADNELKTAVFAAIEQEFASINRQRLAEITDPSKPVPNKLRTTLSIANNTIAAIQALTLLPDAIEMPSWLGGPLAGRSVHEFVPLANGLLDLQLEQQRQAAEVVSFSDGANQPSASYSSSHTTSHTTSNPSPASQSPLRPHTPLLFTATCLPVLYDPQSLAPHWNQFCQTSLDADEEKLSLLQEWFGYCLTPDVSMQKFLLLEGEGRNGKSVVCAALTALLGHRNVSHVRLEQFGDDYSLAETHGKLANIVSEVGELDRVAEGVLKSYTVGDPIMSNRKFKSYLSFVPTARLILATNNRPRFSDRSQGLWRRLLILPLDHYVTDAERVYGMDRQSFWEPELPGMLNWALQGLFALREQRGFTVPQASVRALDDYRDEANPCREFLTEHYQQAETDYEWVESTEIYTAYTSWCKAGGYQPLNSKNFGKEIRRAFPACERTKMRNGETRFWCYTRLRSISTTETDSLFA